MMQTPWGIAQTQTELRDKAEKLTGIHHVTTSSHGGYFVEKPLYDTMKVKETPYSKNGFFEEDCDWAFVAITFPYAFTPEYIQAAHNTLHHAYNGRYRNFNQGVTL